MFTYGTPYEVPCGYQAGEQYKHADVSLHFWLTEVTGTSPPSRLDRNPRGIRRVQRQQRA